MARLLRQWVPCGQTWVDGPMGERIRESAEFRPINGQLVDIEWTQFPDAQGAVLTWLVEA